MVNKVYRKTGRMPDRFWEYALITDENVSIPYDFVLSNKDTALYNSMSEHDKSKVRFAWINNDKQH